MSFWGDIGDFIGNIGDSVGGLFNNADRFLQGTGVGFGGGGGDSGGGVGAAIGGGGGAADYTAPPLDFGNLDYLTGGGGGGGDLSPGSPSIPSYGSVGGDSSGGYAGPGDIGSLAGSGFGDYGGSPYYGGSSSPPISFGDTQSFGGLQSFSPSGGSFAGPFGATTDSGGLSGLTAVDPGGPISAASSFGSGGFGNAQTSFTPAGGIAAGGDSPDPTSGAATASSGGVLGASQVFAPFGTTDSNKIQDQAASGGPFSPQQNNVASPPNAAPTAGTLPPGFTAENVGGGAPISTLAANASAVPPETNPSAGPSGSNPFNPDGSVNTAAYGEPAQSEQYPGQNSLAKGSAGSSGTQNPNDVSPLGKLAQQFGKNAGGAALAGAAGLFNISQANKNGNTANVQGLTSTIPQIQGVINQVQQQAAQIAAQAQPLRDTGTGIVNSAQPISAESQRLMSFVSTGTLPPEYMTQVQEGTKAAKAQAISNAASRGQNVSPGPNGDYSGNSVLQQQLQSIDRQAVILSSTLAQQLYDAGVKGIGAANSTIAAGTGVINAGNSTQQNATALTTAGLNGIGLQQNVYGQLIALDTAKSARIGQAISNFAQALGGGGGGGGTTIKIGANGAPA